MLRQVYVPASPLRSRQSLTSNARFCQRTPSQLERLKRAARCSWALTAFDCQHQLIEDIEPRILFRFIECFHGGWHFAFHEPKDAFDAFAIPAHWRFASFIREANARSRNKCPRTITNSLFDLVGNDF